MHQEIGNKLRWGLWWGARFAVTAILLSGLSLVLSGTAWALGSVVGWAVLLGIAVSCLIGGMIVGLMRSVAIHGGIIGGAATGMTVAFVLAIMVSVVANIFGYQEVDTVHFPLFVGVAGAFLGGFARLLVPILMGEPIASSKVDQDRSVDEGDE